MRRGRETGCEAYVCDVHVIAMERGVSNGWLCVRDATVALISASAIDSQSRALPSLYFCFVQGLPAASAGTRLRIVWDPRQSALTAQCVFATAFLNGG